MMIYDLIYQATAKKRKKARIECARRWMVGVCVVTTAASLGVVTGVLIAPKSGKQVRADLRKCVEKSVDTVEKAVDTVEKAMKRRADDK